MEMTSPVPDPLRASDGHLPPGDPRAWLGDTDVYVIDQLLKGRIAPGMRVLDAGCGRGRNLHYMLRARFDVRAVDADPAAVDGARALAARLAPETDPSRFSVARVEALPFADAVFDVVLSSAVLHFARDDAHFGAMLDEMWRVLAPGGMLFARLSTSIAREETEPLGGHRYRVPEVGDRFLADEPFLRAHAARLDAEWLEPLKTTLVHGLRSMTTWVLRKPGRPG
jgi:tellurite methyltransferase